MKRKKEEKKKRKHENETKMKRRNIWEMKRKTAKYNKELNGRTKHRNVERLGKIKGMRK
jgi:hypothetical protein